MKTFSSHRLQWELRIIGGGETNNICIKMHMGKKEHQLYNHIPSLFSMSSLSFYLTTVFRVDFTRNVNEHSFQKKFFFSLHDGN